eukprot:546942-Prymnesium_polylepis.1
MDDWGMCHAGERDRWQRARARVACLSSEYMLSGNLYIVASVRAPCPTRPQQPCLVRKRAVYAQPVLYLPVSSALPDSRLSRARYRPLRRGEGPGRAQVVGTLTAFVRICSGRCVHALSTRAALSRAPVLRPSERRPKAHRSHRQLSRHRRTADYEIYTQR